MLCCASYLPGLRRGRLLRRTLGTLHSSVFARFACNLFTRPSKIFNLMTFYESIINDSTRWELLILLRRKYISYTIILLKAKYFIFRRLFLTVFCFLLLLLPARQELFFPEKKLRQVLLSRHPARLFSLLPADQPALFQF